MDSRKKTELPHLADGDGGGGCDGVFRPVFGGEGLDITTKVSRGHRRADDVLAYRPHLVLVVWVFDQDVDFGQSEFDGETHAPGAVDDCERAVLLGHGRRLDNADDLDACLYGRVRHFARLDFARVAGVLLQCTGIDASQFHLSSPDFRSSRTSSKMKPRRARAIRLGQRRRVAPGSGRLAKRRDGPALCGGWASRAFDVVCSQFLLLKRLLSDARFHLKCNAMPRRAIRRPKAEKTMVANHRVWSRAVFSMAASSFALLASNLAFVCALISSNFASLRSMTAARSLFIPASTSSALAVAAARCPNLTS